MHRFSIGLALLLALAIIVIGAQYVLTPRAATRSFGLPLPEDGPNITSWLRLKGVRDIASGLAILVVMAWLGPRAAGLVLLVFVLIPLGDLSVILAGKGSARTALGIHGVTAAVMILAAVPLLTGAT